MSRDKRKKGCPNEHCNNHIKHKTFTMDTEFCPECGTALILVCRKCYCQIEDKGPKHRVCTRCQVKGQAKKAKLKHNAKGAAVAGVLGIGGNFAKGANAVLNKKAANLGGNVATKIIKIIIKK